MAYISGARDILASPFPRFTPRWCISRSNLRGHLKYNTASYNFPAFGIYYRLTAAVVARASVLLLAGPFAAGISGLLYLARAKFSFLTSYKCRFRPRLFASHVCDETNILLLWVFMSRDVWKCSSWLYRSYDSLDIKHYLKLPLNPRTIGSWDFSTKWTYD
jgi:hypothetical protein